MSSLDLVWWPDLAWFRPEILGNCIIIKELYTIQQCPASRFSCCFGKPEGCSNTPTGVRVKHAWKLQSLGFTYSLNAMVVWRVQLPSSWRTLQVPDPALFRGPAGTWTGKLPSASERLEPLSKPSLWTSTESVTFYNPNGKKQITE